MYLFNRKQASTSFILQLLDLRYSQPIALHRCIAYDTHYIISTSFWLTLQGAEVLLRCE